jgi:Uma2 family endonuclease
MKLPSLDRLIICRMNITMNQANNSVKGYIDYAESNEVRAEYFDGTIRDLDGSSSEHSLILVNIASEIKLALKPKNMPCRVYAANALLAIDQISTILVPDVYVVCGPQLPSAQHASINTAATLVVEVMSESTISFDRGEKFEHYQLIPSLQEYVLVEQVEARVEVFSRRPSGPWKRKVYWGMEDVVKLDSIQVEIPMALIYADVVFED